MTELGLIVGIDVVGLVLALLMWRSVSVRDGGPPSIRRLGSAIERAARAFLWQEYRLIAIAVAVLLVIGVGVCSTVDLGTSSLSRLAVAFWCFLGLCLGAFGATVSGYFGAVLAVRGSVRSAAASGTSVDAALGVAMRAAGGAGLLAEALSGLSLTALFWTLVSIQGGLAMQSPQTLPLAARLLLILPSFALGAAVSALILQRGGGAFHASSGVGADQAGERDAGLEHDDARNPAVVAELVGDHVGASATRHVDGFASASIANVACLIIGATLSGATASADPLLLLAFPLVVRAFGVIASGFGVLLVRADETSSVSRALLRGYLSTAIISFSAFGGTSYWLFGEHFLPVFLAGSLGLVSVLLAAHAPLLRLGRRSDAVRESADALRVGSGALVASGFATGAQAALPPVLLVCLGAASSFAIGAHSGMSAGAEICVLMFTLGALSIGPFGLSVATLGSIADAARGMAGMCNLDGELKRRSTRLDDAGFVSAAIARHYAVFCGALSSLLVAWAIVSQSANAHAASAPEPPSLAADSVLVCCGALGAAVAFGYAGSVARAALRGAREVSAEVERQLRGFPRERGVAQVPVDYTPSYKSCVELSAAVALRRALLPMAAGVSAPVLLGVGLRLAFRSFAPTLVGLGLTWFVIVASLAGLSWTLAMDATRVAIGSVRRANRTRDNGTAFNNSISADVLSDIFGNAAAPALQLLVKATAATALLITPFLV